MILQNGMPFAKSLAVWKDAPSLWQARSALVPFTVVAGDSAYYLLIKTIATSLIHREERFAKTAVGWILRNISKHSPKYVEQFLADNLTHFTAETVRNATKYFGKREQKSWIDNLRGVSKERDQGNKKIWE